MIRKINTTSAIEIELIAARMRLTLIEVLGEERGTAMYTMDWLRERVMWHLDPSREAQVFLSENPDGHVTGHTIVRADLDGEGKRIGLFSTIFVTPESRRSGIARALIERGEAWMIEHGMPEAHTYTSATNHKLIELLRKNGYEIAERATEMVRLEKLL